MTKYIYTIITLALFSVACTGNFEDINTSESGLQPGQAPIESEFAQPQQSIYHNYGNTDWEYQLQQNLNADLYSGYLTPPTPFAGNNNNGLYFMVSGWNGMAYEKAQLNILKPTRKILEVAEQTDYQALAKIIRVAGMHRVSDIYGPITYTTTGGGAQSYAYDSQETVYKLFFTDLDDAINKLTKYLDTDLKGVDDPATNRITFDLMCGKSYSRWIRFANTLRLRLAMRIVKVNPELAKQQAELAVNHKYGTLNNVDDANNNIEVIAAGLTNPLHVIAWNYGDIRVSASFISILEGLKDPRLEKLVLPVGWLKDAKTGEAIDISVAGKPLNQIGKYIGIRQGTEIADKMLYVMYSNINMPKDDKTTKTNPLPIMKVAEAYFLRAEGALRGWKMNGTAKDLYEMGVKTAFADLNLDAQYPAYIANATDKPANYVDPREPKHNINAVSSVTVAWNEGGSNEEKLEKIITQKWIALFPEGQEAWSEFRRTGYPKLFPVFKNLSNGVIPTGEYIKRLPLTEKEYNINNAETVKAVNLLNGPDNINTRLWWDVAKPNF